MGGNSQKWNGCGYTTESPVRMSNTERGRMEFARLGFQIPRDNLQIDARRFWTLTGEGWRFVVGEDGCIVACLPPHLSMRLEALNRMNEIARGKKRRKT